MSLGKKIKNAAIRFFFGRLVNRIEKKVAQSQNQALNNAVLASLELSEDYIHILTDKDPNDKEQVNAYFKENTLQHIEAAKALLLLPIEQINKPYLKEDLVAFIKLLEDTVKGEVDS